MRTQNAPGSAQQQQRHNPLGRCHVRLHVEGQQQHAGADNECAYDFRLAAIRTHALHFTNVLCIRLADDGWRIIWYWYRYFTPSRLRVMCINQSSVTRSLAQARDNQIQAVYVGECM